LPLENVPEEVAMKVVMREKLLVAVHKDHALAKKNRISCAALRHEELVLYSRADGKSALDEHIRAIAEKGGFNPEVAQRAHKLTAIIGLVAGGSGVAIVPESLRYMHVPLVVFRPLADIQRVSELAVAYRRDEHSPAASFFLGKLTAVGQMKRVPSRRKDRSPELNSAPLTDLTLSNGDNPH
jgi:DNA-binding transcriptional LysR family regulator